MKTYTILKTHRGKTREVTGTIPELIEYFGYTLECGASWSGHRGCRKVNKQPKTIKSLVIALNNAVHNTQGSCYDPDYYEYVD